MTHPIVLFSSGSSKFTRDVTESVIKFCMDELIPKVRNLTIDVKFSKMKNEEYQMFGDCMDVGSREYTMRLFLDEINDLTTLVSTICHEMVHVKQFIRGEYNPVNDTWNGKKIKKTGLPPWEKEAYAEEKKLSKKFWKEVNIRIK